ncbi:hypothetical protein [Nakamurella aerolata]|uniref:Uncharacterized protein n=1 Tax=Nakamurella aerolata TaxID=1656892 RepID=A0A849A9F2_9ACTN|nr:hypothetical protein [Nakamurella aerolata]NNG37169.1 hypothetical protein [Nakamurella aerolata]
MSSVRLPLVDDWTQHLFAELQRSRTLFGVGVDGAEQSAVGSGMAAIRAVVCGEPIPEQTDAVDGTALGGDGPAGDGHQPGEPTAAGALREYLRGVAAGIAAAGADGSVIPLVAGLVTGGAQLRFHALDSVPAAGGVSAGELASRAGLAAADVAGDGGDVGEVARAFAEAAQSGWSQRLTAESGAAEPTGIARQQFRLRVLLRAVAVALSRAAGAEVAPPRAGCGAEPGSPGGRAFLAELTFSVDTAGRGDALVAALQDALDPLGTDLRVWYAPGTDANERNTAPAADAKSGRGSRVHQAAGQNQSGQNQSGAVAFHLHTTRPGEAITQVYALTTPFELSVRTLEPALHPSDGFDGWAGPNQRDTSDGFGEPHD